MIQTITQEIPELVQETRSEYTDAELLISAIVFLVSLPVAPMIVSIEEEEFTPTSIEERYYKD